MFGVTTSKMSIRQPRGGAGKVGGHPSLEPEGEARGRDGERWVLGKERDEFRDGRKTRTNVIG